MDVKLTLLGYLMMISIRIPLWRCSLTSLQNGTAFYKLDMGIQFMLSKKTKNTNTSVETFLKSNRKVVERGKIDILRHKYMTSNTQIHDL